MTITDFCSLVEALCYKQEGCGSDSRGGHRFFFSIYLILLATLWPLVGLGFQQKKVSGIFLEGEARLAREADNFAVICGLIV
jgi:hypothetical protein